MIKFLKATHISMVALATETNQPQKHCSLTVALLVIKESWFDREVNLTH